MRFSKPLKRTVTLDTPEKVEEALRLIAKAIEHAGEYEVTIQPTALRPSPTQRGLYRIWIRQIANHTGNTQVDVHKGLAEIFLTTVAVNEHGEEILTGESTQELTREDMAQYLDWVSYFAFSEFGLRLDSKPKIHQLAFTTPIRSAA